MFSHFPFHSNLPICFRFLCLVMQLYSIFPPLLRGYRKVIVGSKGVGRTLCCDICEDDAGEFNGFIRREVIWNIVFGGWKFFWRETCEGVEKKLFSPVDSSTSCFHRMILFTVCTSILFAFFKNFVILNYTWESPLYFFCQEYFKDISTILYLCIF